MSMIHLLTKRQAGLNSAPMRRLLCLCALSLFAASLEAKAAQEAPLLLRATRNVQWLGDYNITANPTRQGATDAFGELENPTAACFAPTSATRSGAARASGSG
jgi:hypothetical protein